MGASGATLGLMLAFVVALSIIVAIHEYGHYIVGRWKGIQEQHGKDAVGVYVGNPTVHDHGAMMFLPLFLRALRTKNKFSASSVDQLPHQLAAYLMFGHQFLIPVPDVAEYLQPVVTAVQGICCTSTLMPGFSRSNRGMNSATTSPSRPMPQNSMWVTLPMKRNPWPCGG